MRLMLTFANGQAADDTICGGATYATAAGTAGAAGAAGTTWLRGEDRYRTRSRSWVNRHWSGTQHNSRLIYGRRGLKDGDGRRRRRGGSAQRGERKTDSWRNLLGMTVGRRLTRRGTTNLQRQPQLFSKRQGGGDWGGGFTKKLAPSKPQMDCPRNV